MAEYYQGPDHDQVEAQAAWDKRCPYCNDTGLRGVPDFPGDDKPITVSFCSCAIGRASESRVSSFPDERGIYRKLSPIAEIAVAQLQHNVRRLPAPGGRGSSSSTRFDTCGARY